MLSQLISKTEGFSARTVLQNNKKLLKESPETNKRNLFSLPDKDMNGGVERHKGKPEHQKHVELLHESDG